jgi:hypothetical protein
MRVARAAPARRHPIATPATAPPDSPFLVVDCAAVVELDTLLGTETTVLAEVGVLDEMMGSVGIDVRLVVGSTIADGTVGVTKGVTGDITEGVTGVVTGVVIVDIAEDTGVDWFSF